MIDVLIGIFLGQIIVTLVLDWSMAVFSLGMIVVLMQVEILRNSSSILYVAKQDKAAFERLLKALHNLGEITDRIGIDKERFR